ncbi:MAG: hypothetical protein IT449_04895 [Phycisphaerales bacterium]|nr:hypothetical protein [Phycisphaerales bacterium]
MKRGTVGAIQRARARFRISDFGFRISVAVGRAPAAGLVCLAALLSCCAEGFASEPPEQAELIRTDSRSPFVHRIGLYDEGGGAINPADKNAPPYSPRATCGKCHEVGTIGHGWHFNAGVTGSTQGAAAASGSAQESEPPSVRTGTGRPGEPWIYTDAATGTQIPLSFRGWPGTYRPEQIGLTAWEFAKSFGRHLPGGGVVFPSEVADPPGVSRWPLAGGLDIDCMLCHSDDNRHDPAERAKQIERENFRWIPTVSLGLAVVRGDTSKLPDDFDASLGPNPDFPEQQPPRLEYDKSRFDADHRVLLGITKRPSADRCYFCHSVREVGEGAPQPWHTDDDVHLRAGMTCTDCHRNGIDHMIRRGYEGEPTRSGDAAAGTLTCRGCHLGETAAGAALLADATARPGRLGAPTPLHAGLPSYHLEELSCTACHSGPAPGMAAKRFQTSLAHALGIPTRTRHELDDPAIVGPVFLKGADGRLAPHRVLRPAMWGARTAEGIAPLAVAKVARMLRKPLADAGRTPGSNGPLTPDQITAGLKAIAPSMTAGEQALYLADEQAYSLAADGSLVAVKDERAKLYAWPIAHDVRPAAASLGAGGCVDCHADDAPLYAGRTVDASAGGTGEAAGTTMLDARGVDAALARSWNRSMHWRGAFKVAACIGLGVVAWFALAKGLTACANWMGRS